MSMKTILLAAATAATLAVPAAAMAQDWGRHAAYEARDAQNFEGRRFEERRWVGEYRRPAPVYDYGYGYGYDAYRPYVREVRPEWRDRNEHRDWRADRRF
jgi:hypothetical protein